MKKLQSKPKAGAFAMKHQHSKVDGKVFVVKVIVKRNRGVAQYENKG